MLFSLRPMLSLHDAYPSMGEASHLVLPATAISNEPSVSNSSFSCRADGRPADIHAEYRAGCPAWSQRLQVCLGLGVERKNMHNSSRVIEEYLIPSDVVDAGVTVPVLLVKRWCYVFYRLFCSHGLSCAKEGTSRGKARHVFCSLHNNFQGVWAVL